MAKNALIVGINVYANPSFNLRGCIYDGESLARLLVDVYGFGGTGIAFLRDAAATRAGILSALENLLRAARSGDTLVFAFSGHGTQTASTDPGEPDVKDECLVPHEGSYNSLIKDDELYALFNRYLDPNIKFTAIYDCCHAGTMLRTCDYDLVTGELVEETINRLIDAEDLVGCQVRSSVIGPYNILSACQDGETAADLRAAGQAGLPRGAFSYALHDFLRTNRDVPVALAEPQILGAIQAVSRHVQNPSYTLLDVNTPLIRY